jgi:hypothetical protein
MVEFNHGSATAQQVASHNRSSINRAKASRSRPEALNREKGIIANLNYVIT